MCVIVLWKEEKTCYLLLVLLTFPSCALIKTLLTYDFVYFSSGELRRGRQGYQGLPEQDSGSRIGFHPWYHQKSNLSSWRVWKTLIQNCALSPPWFSLLVHKWNFGFRNYQWGCCTKRQTSFLMCPISMPLSVCSLSGHSSKHASDVMK